jgi:hypothetical protein
LQRSGREAARQQHPGQQQDLLHEEASFPGGSPVSRRRIIPVQEGSPRIA